MKAQSFRPKRFTRLLDGTLRNLFYPPEEHEYEYFSRAAQFPFAGNDDVVKAAWAADTAMLSYARYGPRRMTDDELQCNLERGGLQLETKIGEDPSDWNARGVQALFATGNGFSVLAFRGTEVDDPADKIADLDLPLVLEPGHRGAATPRLGFLSLVEHLLSPCLVHRGFQAALNRVWDQVHATLLAYRAKEQNAEICITGHSLGGALAVLTYSRFADANTSAYTIGCPRAGNSVFRQRVAEGCGKGHFRIVNCDDLVAHIPLESALYVHSPLACYRFEEAGCLNYAEEDAFSVDLRVVTEACHGLPADFAANISALAQLPAPPGIVDHSPSR